jgi:hypothetical protein
MKYQSRKFLNPKTGVAAIECSAELTHKWFDINVKITDCSRAVNLQFEFSDIKGYKERRAKLILIINELSALLASIDDKMADPAFRKSLK